MRSLLSYVASFFCPLVLVATCALLSKIRMQDLTRRKADCDETMTWEELSRWKFAPVNFIVYKYFRLIAVLLQLSWKQSQNWNSTFSAMQQNLAMTQLSNYEFFVTLKMSIVIC